MEFPQNYGGGGGPPFVKIINLPTKNQNHTFLNGLKHMNKNVHLLCPPPQPRHTKSTSTFKMSRITHHFLTFQNLRITHTLFGKKYYFPGKGYRGYPSVENSMKIGLFLTLAVGRHAQNQWNCFLEEKSNCHRKQRKIQPRIVAYLFARARTQLGPKCIFS